MHKILAAAACALPLLAPTARARPSSPAVSLFVQGAALGNLFEIEESKIMLEDGTDERLRAFATEMVRDHGAAQAKLRAAAAVAGVASEFSFDPASQKLVNDIGLMDGDALDKTYLADQLQAHARAAATLQAYAATGEDPGLRAYAAATLPTVLRHQRELEDITGQPAPM